MSDYELLGLINEFDDQARMIMYKRYQPLILKNVQKLYTLLKKYGYDKEDIYQELMMTFEDGLIKYDQQQTTIFSAYLKSCIEKKGSNLIRSVQTKKRLGMKSTVSLEENILEAINHNVIRSSEIDEEIGELLQILKLNLTFLEVVILEMWLQDFSRQEMSNLLDKTPKSVSNTLGRIKNKLQVLSNYKS